MSYIGGIEVLSQPVRKKITEYFAADEKILYCVMGDKSDRPHAIVALEQRLIYYRDYGFVGLITANKSFEYRSIEYIDVKSINITHRPLTLCVNNLASVTMPNEAETELVRFTEWLRIKVRQERKEITITQDSSQPAASISSELEKLASLHQSGVLSQQEFEAAKRKLLGL